uniref:NF-kappa-B inhibitor-like protein 1 n=1 Tax=Bos indicus x Bos taurus TaxID=30522 RepID=A0A4W2C1J2_BOBOX
MSDPSPQVPEGEASTSVCRPKSSMASTSRRQRRERRFRRYLSAGRLVRAQALLQRHPGLDVDAGQPPPLHRACARHDAPALCLLLRLGADPAHQDRHGDTALHAAARQGPDAYTDFFLPLLSRCPSAMGIKNKDGETPGQILGWGPPGILLRRRRKMRPLRNGNGDRSCRESWRTSGRRSSGDLKMMLPMRPRNPSPSQPGQIAWPGNMPRSTSSSGVRQREPADPHGLRAPGTAGGSRRRSSGSSESEPGPKRRNCVRAEPGGRRRRSGIALRSRPELGPGQSTPEAQGGADSGALVMCLGPALGEGTQKPWLQHWWPGVPPWRNRGL